LLSPREQLERIQELLTMVILVQGGSQIPECLRSSGSRSFYGFVIGKRLPHESGIDDNDNSRRMTINISKTKREVLDNY
jgi:hypothetical protein